MSALNGSAPMTPPPSPSLAARVFSLEQSDRNKERRLTRVEETTAKNSGRITRGAVFGAGSVTALIQFLERLLT